MLPSMPSSAARLDAPRLDAAELERRFESLLPLMQEEWPELAEAELRRIGPDADALVAHIAERTGQGRVMSRRLLAELLDLCAPRAARPRPRAAPAAASGSEPLDNLVASLEAWLDDLTRQVKREVAPMALNSARQHIGMALLLAGGLGLMVGLVLGALGYPHEKTDGD